MSYDLKLSFKQDIYNQNFYTKQIFCQKKKVVISNTHSFHKNSVKLRHGFCYGYFNVKLKLMFY